MKWTLDIEQQRQEIADGEQLRKQLLAEHQKATREPIIALLNAPDGSSLAIGLGLQRSVLNHIAPGGWPSRHAVDDSAGAGLAKYKLAGQMSEVPMRGTVALDDAIDACVDFMTTGTVGGKLNWEDD